MRKPKENRPYILVRVINGRIEQAEFTRFDDDSVSVIAEGRIIEVEFSPGAWKLLWADLEAQGYVEIRKARATGLVPADWKPSA